MNTTEDFAGILSLAWFLVWALGGGLAFGVAHRLVARTRGGKAEQPGLGVGATCVGREPLPALGLAPAGLALGMATVLLAFVAWAAAAGQLGPLDHGDQALMRRLASLTPEAIRTAAAVLTHLGDAATVTVWGGLLTLGLLARGHRRAAVMIAAALLLQGSLVRLLKQSVERSRPLFDEATQTVWGSSFPSGHASASMAVALLTAYAALRWAPRHWQVPMVALALTVAWTVGLSRVVLQVHHLSDVLAGWWLAALCVGLALRAIERRV